MTGVIASLIDLVQAKHTSKTKSAGSDSLSFRDRFAHFSFALADFFPFLPGACSQAKIVSFAASTCYIVHFPSEDSDFLETT